MPAPDWPDKSMAREQSEQSEQKAFHELFKRYGIAYEINDARTPCEAAESVNLRCLAARGNFEQIPSDWLLSPPTYERDLHQADESLRLLRRMILDFPDDPLVGPAQQLANRPAPERSAGLSIA